MAFLHKHQKVVRGLVWACLGFGLSVITILGMPEEQSARVADIERVSYLAGEKSNADILEEAIRSARSDLLIVTDTLTDQNIVKLLQERSQSGIRIAFLLSRDRNRSPTDPRYLVGWLRSNKIGQVSLAGGESLNMNFIAVDGKAIVAFSGPIDSDLTMGATIAPANTPAYESMESKIRRTFTYSENVTVH